MNIRFGRTHSLLILLSLLGSESVEAYSARCARYLRHQREIRLTQQKLDRVREAFLLGEKNALYDGESVFARVLRGKSESDFTTLTDDVERRVVFFMDQSGLASIAGKQGDPLLYALGYTEDYVRSLRSSGTKFRLVIFSKNENVVPATWENLQKIAADAYPNGPVALLFARYSDALKSISFLEIEKQAPLTFAELSSLSRTDPRHIRLDKLTPESELWEFRAFLYNEFRVTELYSGDGYTVLPDGTRGLAEYISVAGSKKLDEVGPYVEIEIR